MGQTAGNPFPQPSWLAQQLQAMPGKSPAGVSPDPMQAMAYQSLQNPNAGDQFQALPGSNQTQNGDEKKKNWGGPQIPVLSSLAGGATIGEMLLAMGGGGALGYAINFLSQSDRMMHHAQLMEKIPGFGHISRGLDGTFMPESLRKQDWWRYYTMSHPEADTAFDKAMQAKKAGNEGAKVLHLEEAREILTKNAQDVHLTRTVRSLNGHFNASRRWSAPWSKSKDVSAHYDALHQAVGGINLKELAKSPELAKKHDLENIVNSLKAHIDHLEKQTKLSKENQHLLHALNGAHDHLEKGLLLESGVAAGSIKDSVEMALKAREANLGVFGKGYISFLHQMRNIFCGDFLTAGSDLKGKGLAGLMKGAGGMAFGILVSSAMVIAPAIHAGNEADKGDKKKAFFENFIGFGIFNFIGWEMGRRFLARTGIVQKLMGRHALKHPLKIFGNKKYGSQWARRMTLVGFGTELLAMFAFGSLAQSGGEWLSHKIFGKPKKKEEQAPPPQAVNDAIDPSLMQNPAFALQNAYSAPPSTMPNTPLPMSPTTMTPFSQSTGMNNGLSSTPSSASMSAPQSLNNTASPQQPTQTYSNLFNDAAAQQQAAIPGLESDQAFQQKLNEILNPKPLGSSNSFNQQQGPQWGTVGA
jgi:hypothetical protein